MPLKLLVLIPTWNRAAHLDRAIGAISAARAQAKRCTVEAFISDNCSTDGTAEVVARWQAAEPWIHARTWPTHTSAWVEVFTRVLTGASLDYDYAWLQGDDDWITDGSAYEQVVAAIEADPANPPALLHCCPAGRAIPGDTRIVPGLTEDLCNAFGWHDLLGWISSLVMSRDTVGRMLASPRFSKTNASAFPHAEALLEAAYGQTMLVLGQGLIAPQDDRQTPETLARWEKQGVGPAYWATIPGLLSLKQRGILKTPLTLAFFRYLTYSLWDRFGIEVLAKAADRDAPDELIDTKLQLLGHITQLLGFGEDRKLYQAWLDGFTDDVWAVRRTTELMHRRFTAMAQPSYSDKLFSLDGEGPGA